MSQQKTEASVFRICAVADGWTVIKFYCRKSVADFAARDDALEYAISLAQSQREAVVEIYGEEVCLKRAANTHADQGTQHASD